MPADILVVDLAAVLDQSKVGAEAARSLEKAWHDASNAPEPSRAELYRQLVVRREALRERLVERARPLIAEIGAQRGALAVLEKGGVAWTRGDDITAQVISRVDALGPL